MYKIILAAIIFAAASYSAVARQVCEDIEVNQINCKTVNGKQSCSLVKVPAQICREVPDKPAGGAASRADEVTQFDNGTGGGSNTNLNFKKNKVFFVQ